MPTPSITIPETPPKVLCLVGPTGAGKTAAALHLAERFGGIVINADSRQVYRDVPIITAQPSAEEQAVCPHHLYGFLAMDEAISAGIWGDLAAEQVYHHASLGHVPMLVGGTGMYVKSLLEGIVNIPSIPAEIHEALQEECARRGSVRLHERLVEVDPAYAARIHANDRQRITRALEVFEFTGKAFSAWHADTKPLYPMKALKIGFAMTLEQLQPRLGLRIDQMLSQGALGEAENAWLACPHAKAAGWTGIGCAELLAYMQGHYSLNAACDAWLRNTRAYAKRQLTWFNADKEIHWFDPRDVHGMADLVEAFLE
ncbi:MAG: tRNA (adenosine(37)-N6)-dimethylallyltransferase MiaA [Pseudomonadota bacterium]